MEPTVEFALRSSPGDAPACPITTDAWNAYIQALKPGFDQSASPPPPTDTVTMPESEQTQQESQQQSPAPKPTLDQVKAKTQAQENKP